MKNLTCLFCVCALGCAFFAACDWNGGAPKTKAEEEQKVEVKENEGTGIAFEEYSLTGTSSKWTNLDYDNKGKLLVINSDGEMKKYVEGDYPSIDFSKKTLLLAFGSTPNSGTEPIIKSFKKPSAENYQLYIDVIMGDATRPDTWCMALITDKLSRNSDVELSVSIIN